MCIICSVCFGTCCSKSVLTILVLLYFYSASEISQHQHYKRKRDQASCDNHRGISLLATIGKLLGRVMLNRLTENLLHKVLPESQCAFHSGHGTADMIFTAHQIQEKCGEQKQNLLSLLT